MGCVDAAKVRVRAWVQVCTNSCECVRKLMGMWGGVSRVRVDFTS